MTQPQIDLLPESIRRSCQRGVRMGQYLAAAALGIAVVVIATTHVRMDHRRVSERLHETREQADYVLRLESETAKLKAQANRAVDVIQLQQRLAWPMDVSAIIATMVNHLPASVAIERIDLDAGAHRSARATRTRSDIERAEPSRIMRGEIAGFAATDEDIAELINRLHETPPFSHVTLDFSRSRAVHGKAAREFRLSFRIDMEQRYDVEYITFAHTQLDKD